MNYLKKQIKKGINLHLINTKKFKTNLLSVFITNPLTKENITKEALISAVLRRGTLNEPSQEEISIKLENMYGASFDCGIEKMGDYHILKFYLETINDEFLPKKEDILKQSINEILDIVLNPLIENDEFKNEYVDSEKENLKQIINGKIDNKSRYAFDRCIEEMYEDKPYGLYKYGYIEDLQNITAKDLYNYFKKMLSECKIDIFVSGDININEVEEIVKNNVQIQKLEDREFNIQNEVNETSRNEAKIVSESMQVTQGKLVLGYDVRTKNKEEKYIVLLYNTILGSGANSKLFQNVREKASLAYTAASNYIRQKDNIFIRAGIEIENYEKTLKIIKEQVEDMKNGKFDERDIEDAKRSLISTIKFIPDEQDTEISYYFGQEFTGQLVSFEEYIEKIQNISKDQIIDIANRISLNTIYFLKD